MKEIRDLLTDHTFFKDLPSGMIDFIAGCGSNAHFKKGERIFHEGEESDYFYIIRQGRIALEIDGAERGVINVQTVEAGDILGWSWLIPPHSWRFTGVAVEDTNATALDGKCLREKCQKDHELGYELLTRFAGVLSQRLERTRWQLLDVYGDK